jgi:hypothetical protein
MELMRYMRLEASWILINVSTCERSSLLEPFLKSESFIKSLNEILASEDVQMIDHIVQFISNVVNCDMIVDELCFLDHLPRIIDLCATGDTAGTELLINVSYCLQQISL